MISAPRPLKDEGAERAQFGRRVRFVGTVMLGLLLLVGVRFAYLQLGEHETYAARADDNRVSLRALGPNRGLIYDRRGRLLAENRPAYRLVVNIDRVADMDATLAELERLLALTDEELTGFRERVRRGGPNREVALRLNLDDTETARLAVNRHRLPGVDIEPYLTRYYPHGELLAHIVGYVGRLDNNDLRRIETDDYRATSHIGKTGIERYYEEKLHGASGYERVETNAEGRVIRVLERQDPKPGQNLVLGLDLDLQAAASAALDGRSGAVVVLHVPSGELRALVSEPGYDPNRFVDGVSRAYYNRLLTSAGRPLFNRVLSGGYEPGSTIKPFIGLTGLTAGAITPETEVFSGGYFQLPGQDRRYRDWRQGGHGNVDLTAALEESVNVYFYKLAVDLGIDRIHAGLGRFGFGVPTGVDLPGESGGILPSRAWKRGIYGQPWYPGETVITGIGQGFLVVTPLQLAQATALLVRDAPAPGPHLARGVAETEPGMVQVDPDHRAAIIRGMKAVVQGRRGTAREIADMVPAPVAGKSGTAQVYGRPQDDSEISDEPVPVHLEDHALFTGFTPADAPRFVVTVVVEHGGGGSRVAAPVAARVMAAALELDP